MSDHVIRRAANDETLAMLAMMDMVDQAFKPVHAALAQLNEQVARLEQRLGGESA